VREEVVGLKQEVQRGGTTARELAKVLGLHESTLCRWEREVRMLDGRKTRGQAASRFRMVKVAAPEARSAGRVAGLISSDGGLRVAHAPSGLVIDGLDVESLAALLQRMS
jgi:DNA-binding XRE family transcriptional regulator